MVLMLEKGCVLNFQADGDNECAERRPVSATNATPAVRLTTRIKSLVAKILGHIQPDHQVPH